MDEPRRIFYDLDGPATHRCAQVRHTLAALLHCARREGFSAAIGDQDFGRRGRRRSTVAGRGRHPSAAVPHRGA